MLKQVRFFMILVMALAVLAGTGFSATSAQASWGGCDAYHTVRRGDTLSSIARWYGAYWPHLAQINGIPGPQYKIFPGQVLCIQKGTYYPGYYQPPKYTPPYYYPPSTYTPSGAAWSFSIIRVVRNETVTIRTAFFPSNVLFKAKMGFRSGGKVTWVDLPDIDSGKGGKFDVVFNIPAEFKGASQLVIRIIQENKNGKVFHSDQWFSNIEYVYSEPVVYNYYPSCNPPYYYYPYGYCR